MRSVRRLMCVFLYPFQSSAAWVWLFVLIVWELVSGLGSVVAGEVYPGWRAKWESTVDAAKREGQVTIYGSRGYQLIVDAGVFQKAYPEIKLVTVSGPSRVYMHRVLTERRAGKYLVDLVIGGASSPMILYGANVLDPIKPALLLPEVLDQSKWWKGHYYNDPERQYVFQYIGAPWFGSMYYNSTLVNPKEFTSFWDFLNPKWKGKIVVRDVRRGGSGSSAMPFLYNHKQVGPEFLRRFFSEMDITLTRDGRQAADWLVRGRYAICFFCVSSQIGRARKQGLPVDRFGLMKEGAALISQSGSVGLVKNAPHPNAAKVFLNWLLSREGQLTMQRAYVKVGVGASNSFRIDIPKDMIPEQQRIQEGVDYLEVELPEMRALSRDSMRKAIRIMDAALREAKTKRQESR